MNDSYYWSTIIDAVTEIADGYAAEAKSRHSMTRTFGDETFQGFEECPRGETDDDELAKNSIKNFDAKHQFNAVPGTNGIQPVYRC